MKPSKIKAAEADYIRRVKNDPWNKKLEAGASKNSFLNKYKDSPINALSNGEAIRAWQEIARVAQAQNGGNLKANGKEMYDSLIRQNSLERDLGIDATSLFPETARVADFNKIEDDTVKDLLKMFGLPMPEVSLGPRVPSQGPRQSLIDALMSKFR